MITAYHNARLIDASGDCLGGLLVKGDTILYAGESLPQRGDRQVDLKGAAVFPAFIDLHCHLRDPGYPQKETMQSGMRAALKGGYWLLCAMANTDPVIETPAQVEQNLRKAESLRLCRLMQAAAAGVGLRDEIPTDRAALSRVTAVLSNDGNTIFSHDFMRALLEDSRRHGFLISTHCQPERAIVRRDLALLREVGGNLHVGHISHAETAAAIRAAKAEGLSLTCEVTPHHLFGWGSDYKVNPPLRARQDVEALIEGVRDGTIDTLSTDHAPHTDADKAEGAAGIANIEHAMSIYLQVFHENSLPLTRFAAMSSASPARRLGIKAGLLAEGYPASFTVVDLDAEYAIDPAGMVSKSRNTPFGGRTVRGRVLQTIVEGEARYEYR